MKNYKNIKLKELKRISNESNLYFAGYCKLQNLLKFVEPDYYFSNVYGWRFDVYVINGLIITTGYEQPRNKNVKQLQDVEKFEKMAHEKYLNAKNWEQAKNETMKLLEQFCSINGGF